MSLNSNKAAASTEHKRSPYTPDQTAAICDAMNVLLEKAAPDGEFAAQLKICAPGILRRSMRVEIAWDEVNQLFTFV